MPIRSASNWRNFSPSILVASSLAIAIHWPAISFLIHISQSNGQAHRGAPRLVFASVSSASSDKRISNTSDNAIPSFWPSGVNVGTQSSMSIDDGNSSPIEYAAPIRYFRPDEVTQRARVIVDLPKDFSLPAKAPRSLKMSLRINDAGDIDDVLIVEPEVDDDTRQMIIAAFKSMKFQPAQIGDIPVPTEIPIQVFGAEAPEPRE